MLFYSKWSPSSGHERASTFINVPFSAVAVLFPAIEVLLSADRVLFFTIDVLFSADVVLFSTLLEGADPWEPFTCKTQIVKR